jgi:peptidyl-prolyl cis-trans isomerase B (cyclophilin B)
VITTSSRRLAIPLLALTVALVAAACSASGASSTPVGPSASAGASTDCPTSQPDPLPAGETRTVTLDTDKGAIVIGIQATLSPIAAGNFVALASCGYYDGTVFHRLVPDFVIQGGDPTGTGTGGPGYEIKDEPVTTTYHRATVAMARTQAPDSVGSQFFIVLSDGAEGALASANTYQIIGEVTSGMEVVDSIAAMPNSGQDSGNMALEPVAITTATVTNP